LMAGKHGDFAGKFIEFLIQIDPQRPQGPILAQALPVLRVVVAAACRCH